MQFKHCYLKQKGLYINQLNVREIFQGQLHFQYKDTIGR